MGSTEGDLLEHTEMVLQPLFASYQVLEFAGGAIFRGPISPYCEGHRRGVEAGLKRMPGAYGFEQLDGATYLTYTAPAPHVKRVNVPLHVLLLLATVVTTLLAGIALQAELGFEQILGVAWKSLRGDPESLPFGVLSWRLLMLGAPFSGALLLILGAHECGHYVMARRYGMLATPPFFLPAPIPPIGTFGAIIKIRSPMLHRRALLDIGLAGPVAGMVFAVPILIYGLAHSEFVVWTYWREGTVTFGHSALTWGLSRLLLGAPEPGFVLDWLAHPFAWAGWIGLLITSLNLFPIGQLDGGHVAYALVGRWQRHVAWFVIGILVRFSYRYTPMWLVWCIVVPLLVKVAHPPVVIDEVKLGPGRRAVGWLAFVVLALVFIPVPAHVVLETDEPEEAEQYGARQRERQGVSERGLRPEVPLPGAADRLGRVALPARPAARLALPRAGRGDLLLHPGHTARPRQWRGAPRAGRRRLPHGAWGRPRHHQRHRRPDRRRLHQEPVPAEGQGGCVMRDA